MKKMILAILSLSVVLLHGQTQSLQFTRSARTSISISSTEFGAFNRQKFSLGCKFKRTGFGIHSAFWAKGNGSIANPIPHWSFFTDIDPSDRPEIVLYGGPQGQTRLALFTGNINLRNMNVHTFQLDVDTTRPVSSERLKVWIDGNPVAPYGYVQWPALNSSVYADEPVSIGGNSVIGNPGSANYYFQGYQQNCWFMSGRNPPVSEVVTETSPNVISFIKGDSTPISLDLKSGKTWSNNGVIYGPPL